MSFWSISQRCCCCWCWWWWGFPLITIKVLMLIAYPKTELRRQFVHKRGKTATAKSKFVFFHLLCPWLQSKDVLAYPPILPCFGPESNRPAQIHPPKAHGSVQARPSCRSPSSHAGGWKNLRRFGVGGSLVQEPTWLEEAASCCHRKPMEHNSATLHSPPQPCPVICVVRRGCRGVCDGAESCPLQAYSWACRAKARRFWPDSSSQGPSSSLNISPEGALHPYSDIKQDWWEPSITLKNTLKPLFVFVTCEFK